MQHFSQIVPRVCTSVLFILFAVKTIQLVQDQPKIKSICSCILTISQVDVMDLYNTMLSAYKDSLLPLERMSMYMYIKNSNGP